MQRFASKSRPTVENEREAYPLLFTGFPASRPVCAVASSLRDDCGGRDFRIDGQQRCWRRKASDRLIDLGSERLEVGVNIAGVEVDLNSLGRLAVEQNHLIRRDTRADRRLSEIGAIKFVLDCGPGALGDPRHFAQKFGLALYDGLGLGHLDRFNGASTYLTDGNFAVTDVLARFGEEIDDAPLGIGAEGAEEFAGRDTICWH